MSQVERPEEKELLENRSYSCSLFARPSTCAYALAENFQPPPPPQGPFASFELSAEQLQPPEAEEGSPVLKLLLAPVYVLPGGAKFVVGVPLTVLLWVLLPCLGWELVRRTGKSSEKLRKVPVACLVVILVLAVMLVVKGYAPPMQPGPYPP